MVTVAEYACDPRLAMTTEKYVSFGEFVVQGGTDRIKESREYLKSLLPDQREAVTTALQPIGYVSSAVNTSQPNVVEQLIAAKTSELGKFWSWSEQQSNSQNNNPATQQKLQKRTQAFAKTLEAAVTDHRLPEIALDAIPRVLAAEYVTADFIHMQANFKRGMAVGSKILLQTNPPKTVADHERFHVGGDFVFSGDLMEALTVHRTSLHTNRYDDTKPLVGVGDYDSQLALLDTIRYSGVTPIPFPRFIENSFFAPGTGAQPTAELQADTIAAYGRFPLYQFIGATEERFDTFVEDNFPGTAESAVSDGRTLYLRGLIHALGQKVQGKPVANLGKSYTESAEQHDMQAQSLQGNAAYSYDHDVLRSRQCAMHLAATDIEHGVLDHTY